MTEPPAEPAQSPLSVQMKFNFPTSLRSNKDGYSLPGDGKQRAELELRLLPFSGVPDDARGMGGGWAATAAPREPMHTQAQPLAHTPWPTCLAIAGSSVSMALTQKVGRGTVAALLPPAVCCPRQPCLKLALITLALNKA